jgi:hypothetical protein
MASAAALWLMHMLLFLLGPLPGWLQQQTNGIGKGAAAAAAAFLSFSTHLNTVKSGALVRLAYACTPADRFQYTRHCDNTSTMMLAFKPVI